jgi:hypothetical protein
MGGRLRSLVTGLVRAAVLLAMVCPGCGVSDQFTNECYRATQVQPCKAASAVTANDFPGGGTMIFQSADAGPTRKIDRSDCCRYLVSECASMPRDGGACLSIVTPLGLTMCLNVGPDETCPAQPDAAARLQKQHGDTPIASVDSPPTRQVTINESCCYTVRRHWDGG